jgi:GTP-binding protein
MPHGSYTPEEIEAGEALFRRPCRFVKSVPALEFLPDPDRPEAAFAGRSNVGKSSLINALANRHGLARASNTPGRTQELNYFEPTGAALFLVDMPGYGFAQAPKAKVEQWTALVKDYLRGRQTLARVFLLIDARHGLKPPDREVMALMDEAAVSYQGVLTKLDKLKPTEIARVERATAEELAKHAAAYPVLLSTSAETGAGIAELRAEVARIANLQETSRPASTRGHGAAS